MLTHFWRSNYSFHFGTNCHDFISQNVRIFSTILDSWCGKQTLLSRSVSSSFLQHLQLKFLIVFPSRHIWDFPTQAQLLSPLKSYVQFEKWLWGISYYSPKPNTLRLSINQFWGLWKEWWCCVKIKNYISISPLFRDNITNGPFFFKFSSAYLRGIYLVVGPVIIKKLL